MVGRLGTLLLFSALVAGCDQQGEWTAFVFKTPTKLDENARPIVVEGLHSYRECVAAAKAELRRIGDPGGGLYECGKDCDWSSDVQQNVCKQTVKPRTWISWLAMWR
jgi:hypothetical protein